MQHQIRRPITDRFSYSLRKDSPVGVARCVAENSVEPIRGALGQNEV